MTKSGYKRGGVQAGQSQCIHIYGELFEYPALYIGATVTQSWALITLMKPCNTPALVS